MFVLDPNPTFTHTITAHVPVDGGFEDQPFKVTYRVMEHEAVAQYKLGDVSGAIDFLRKVVTDFDEIAGVDGQPVSYSDKVRDQLLALPYVREPVLRGYFDAVYQARVGN